MNGSFDHIQVVQVEHEVKVKALDLEVDFKVPYWFHGRTPNR